ncbi:MAG TPA: hypothetical protein VIX86_19845 [Streptosporangiaceae bacterium]
MTEALQGGIAEQLVVLDDASLTGTGQSAADALGVSGAVLAEKLTDHLLWQIMVRGSRGGPLQPLANQLNHKMTRQQTHDAVREFGNKILEAIARQDATRTAQQAGSQMSADVALYVEQLLDDLDLGGHEEAQRRVNRLFQPVAQRLGRLILRDFDAVGSVGLLLRTAMTSADLGCNRLSERSISRYEEDVPVFVELESGGPSPGACRVVGHG